VITRQREYGFTLIELLVSITVGVIVIGGASAAFTGALNGASDTQDQLAGSHDVQLLETYLPPDIQSAQSISNAASDTIPCTGGVAPSANQPTKLRMSWQESASGTTITYDVAYQIVSPTTGEWNLVRYACDSGSAAVKSLVVAHEILDPADSRWSSAGATWITCGRVSLTLIDVTGYSYAVGGNIRTPVTPTTTCPGVTTTTSSTTSTTLISPSPELLEVTMYDTNANGKIDQLVAAFSRPLTGTCQVGTQWTLTDAPSGASVVALVTASQADERTLTITEGSGAANTAVGGFRVAFNPSGTCNATAAPSLTPSDAAGPVLVSISSTDSDRRAEANDTIIFTFSEPIASGLPTAAAVMIDDKNDNETISISNVFSGAKAFVSGTDYVKKNQALNFGSQAVAASGSTMTVRLGTCSGCGDSRVTPLSTGIFSFDPPATYLDADENPSATTPQTSGTLF
jgi:prepilin-type N-terminal cleavage/methylation domain-containing protein